MSYTDLSAQARTTRRTLVLGTLVLLLLASAVVALGIGTIALTPTEVVAALTGQGSGRDAMVVNSIRMPRVLTAIGVGAALGAAGTSFQSISRNPLGSPDIIGFTTGAATGAVAQIVIFNAGPWATALAAMVSGLATAVAVYLLSFSKRASGGQRLVIIGIGVGAMMAAVNTLLLAKGDSDLAAQANLWLSGSLGGRTWNDALLVCLALLILLPVLALQGRGMTLLEMGDDSARALGVSAEKVRRIGIFAAVCLTAAATAAAGPIAFVALAAGQIIRQLIGNRTVPMIPSALTGAVLLVICDVVTQNLPVHAQVPIGLATSMAGGLYLLWLITRPQTRT
ncbi:iron chelate uptake ABC transporter family permease subunit [Glutamicibacter sp. MNS18]|uniref:FecCD family ABC transporter permease n=1 Tax=Glutamicibacter sp. MNS18 TaxID=2989817 RepID=UPI00223580E7|nr:iron chelate uptake ABC transporter family permease subunit [Glutamicibacter sp. MNS18]MCW4465897.1 iron chelate uptake ABC transporter family permease subunit [Glutamicibacter sp. MNS18]